MAEELKTVLGFEAGSAIATLNTMTTALNSYTSAMASAAGATSKFNKSATGVDGKLKSLSAGTKSYTGAQNQQVSTSKRVQNALVKERQLLASVRGAVEKAGSATKKSSGQMILSWQSVIRIFAIQVIHQAISKVTSALKDSIGEAISLEIQFAEIQTISTELSKDFEGVSKSVRAVSDEFGVAAGIVAEGTYQTLSNQVAQGADAFTFLSAAADFGTAAVTKTDSAVNLLSSAINAYGFATSQAATISAKLFKTIEQGRIRGEEFANTYGRVLVLAAELGVSFDEVNASVATLTISGLKYNEAFTLINNIMLKLIRPTEAMKDEFKSMGLVSAEAGIQAFGLQGFLELLRKRAGGTATEMGELFGRVRAIRGALGLTGDAAKTYAKNLKLIQEVSAETILEAKMKIFATSAKQVTVEIQRLRNAIVFDFGRGSLSAINTVIQSMGGLVSIAKAAGLALAVLTTGGIIKGTIALLALNPVISATVLGLAAIAAATFAASLAWDKFTESAIEGIEKRRDTEKAGIEEAKKTEGDLAEIRIRSINKTLSGIQRLITERLAGLQRVKQVAMATETFISDHLNGQLDNRKSAFGSFIKSIESSMNQSADNIANAQKTIFELQKEQSQIAFEGSIKGLSDLKKSTALKRQALKLEEQSNAEAKAGNIENAKALTNDAKAAATSAKQAARAADNKVAFRSASATLLGIQNREIQAAETLVKTEKARGAALAAQLPAEKARQTRIEAIIAKLKEFKLFDTKGDALFASKAEALESIKPLLDTLQKELTEAGSKIDIFSALEAPGATNIADALKNALAGVEDTFTGKEIQLEFAFRQRIQSVFEEIKDIAKNNPIALTLTAELLEQDISSLKGLEDLSKGVVATESILEKSIRGTVDLESAQDEYNSALETSKDISKEVNKNLEAASKITRTRLVASPFGVTGVPSQFDVAGQTFASQKAAIAFQEKFKRITDQVTSATGRANEAITGTFDSQKFQPAITSLQGAKLAFENIGAKEAAADVNKTVKALKEASRATLDVKPLEVQAEGLDKIEGVLQRIDPLLDQTKQSAKDAGEATKGIGTAAQQGAGVATSAFGKTISGLKGIETQAIKTAAAVRAAQSGGGGGAQKAALGGLIYRASGGFTPRGSDRRLAMLSVGEMVMNSKATRQFQSQLIGMNAGVNPQFKQSGGAITNIGDVNISVQGASLPAQTARETMRAFKREMRRSGTSLN